MKKEKKAKKTSYTPAQKRAIYNYKKKNRAKVRYINNKSKAHIFLRDDANLEDLKMLKEVAERAIESISAESLHPDKLGLEEAKERKKTRVYKRGQITSFVSEKGIAIYQGTGAQALLGKVEYSKEKEDFLAAGGNPVSDGWEDTEGKIIEAVDMADLL